MNYTGLFGFDVSKWQGSIDFQLMKSYGAKFVVIKAGQGNWPDPSFETNWKNAKGVLPRASYWYLDNRYPPKDQAEKYFEIIKGDLDGMCWLDLEDRQAGLYAGWRSWYDFIERLKALYPGVRLGIYSGFYYIVEMLSYATRAQRQYFEQFPLWLANYGSDPFHPNYSTIMTPLPWLDYLILQSGTPAIGLEVGVGSREVDYNQFNGDLEKFAQYFGGVVPPVEGQTMEQYKIIWPDGARLRSTPSILGTAGSILQYGTVVNVLQVKPVSASEAWAQHENGLWFATLYNSQPRAEKVTTTLPVDEIFVSVDADITATINGKVYRGTALIDNVHLTAA
jgi:GH25 family lysozyme M1 (1,4-beta-N-acetylmuramidase)